MEPETIKNGALQKSQTRKLFKTNYHGKRYD